MRQASNLDHVVEDEVREDGESVASDQGRCVPQAGVHPGGPGFESVGEPERKISGRDDQVGADDRLGALLEEGEEHLKVVFAKLAGDEHELGEGEAGGRLELRVRILGRVEADFGDDGDELRQKIVAGHRPLFADASDELGLGVISLGTDDLETITEILKMVIALV